MPRKTQKARKRDAAMKPEPLLLLCCTIILASGCAKKNSPEQRFKEMDPAQAERVYQKVVKRWDFNKDGEATCADIDTQRASLFNRLDTDKDGTLTPGEYRYAKFEDKNFMFLDVEQLDHDATTTLNMAEFTAVSHSEFRKMDRDSDCAINKLEAAIAMQNLRRLGEGREPDGDGRRDGRRRRGGGDRTG